MKVKDAFLAHEQELINIVVKEQGKPLIMAKVVTISDEREDRLDWIRSH